MVDVGLGKSIEAGLILSELLLRRRIQRVMILTPASLRSQWRQEMWQRFALPFDTVDQTTRHGLTNLPKDTADIRLLMEGMPANPLFRQTLSPPTITEDRIPCLLGSSSPRCSDISGTLQTCFFFELNGVWSCGDLVVVQSALSG